MIINEIIKEFISKNLMFTNNGFPYGEQDSLIDQGIVDSIGIMILVAFVEDHFKIYVEDSEITRQNFDSIAQLSEYVRNKMKEKNKQN